MKRIKILAGIALVGAFTFAGCSKDNTDYSATPGSSAKTNTAAYKSSDVEMIAPSSITYMMMTTPPPPNAVFQWESGYMTTGSLIFSGTHVVGNMLSMEKFGAAINTTTKLFEPTVLGNVYLQPNFFNYGMFSVQLAPSNSAPALFLNGKYNTNGISTPIQVNLSEQVVLASAWINNVSISSKANDTAVLYISLLRLTDNIDSRAFANADKTNGTIIISATSNPGIYQAMIANLQNNLLDVIFSAASIPTPDPGPVTAKPVNI